MSFDGDNRPLVNWERVNSEGLVSQFGEQLVTNRISDLYLSPSPGISTLRDRVDTTNGSVTLVDGEIQIAVPGTVGSTALLESLGRALYIPGAQGQAGFGVRVPTDPTGDQLARWGLYGNNDGLGFGVDADSYFCFYRNNGTDIIFRPNAPDPNLTWSVDPLDGTGPSGVTLDASQGLIWHVDFTWYGYGTIIWSILDKGDNNIARLRPVHTFTPSQQLSIRDPGQPLRAEVENGAGGGAFQIQVGGRQFSILSGTTRQIRRTFSQPVYNFGPTTGGATWDPLVAIRRKAALDGGQGNGIRTFYRGFESLIGATDSVEFRVTFGASVDAGTWGPPDGVAASETGVEVNDSFTGVGTVGTVVGRGLAPAASRTTVNIIEETANLEMGGDTQVVLWVRPLSGTPSIPAILVNWSELW